MTRNVNQAVISIASVSYLNARPLIWGLEHDPHIRLVLDVPSKLIDHLRDGDCDVALLPTIDYQRLSGLKILPAGGIGSDGQTLTVRIFARQPLEKIRTLACDTDSHTSVALARIILAERFGTRPELIELSKATGRLDEAKLLIGDKVVCEEPEGYPHQYDLGEQWKLMTGLPFVFAVWTAREQAHLGDLQSKLETAKQQGLKHVDEIVKNHAIPRGWPARLAMQYLTEYLKFDISDIHLRAIARFHELAARYALIASPPQPLRIAEDTSTASVFGSLSPEGRGQG